MGTKGHLASMRSSSRMVDTGLLALRLAAGGLLAGHGAQKLFGSFGGYGLEGTAGWLESMGFKPGKAWAGLAGASEFGGGALTALGLMHPIGPIALHGAMATAARRAHWGKPIWVTEGGAELPVLYMASGLTLALTGPGRFSVDRLMGISVPKKVTALATLAVVGGILAGEQMQAEASAEEQQETAQTQANVDATDAAAMDATVIEDAVVEDVLLGTQPAPVAGRFPEELMPTDRSSESETLGTGNA